VTVHWSKDQGHRWRPSREGLTGGQRQAGNLARMRPSGKGLKHEARKAGEMTPGLGQDEGVGSPGVLRPNDTRRAEWAPSVRSELSKGQIWRRLVPLLLRPQRASVPRGPLAFRRHLASQYTPQPTARNGSMAPAIGPIKMVAATIGVPILYMDSPRNNDGDRCVSASRLKIR
jgi:hypothetical protein